MRWAVSFQADFVADFDRLPVQVQDEIAALGLLLERFGPQLGRPHADTLVGSRHANMKVLRFQADGGVWRVAFAFDPVRAAILLVAGDKAGVSERRFYRRLIETADRRFEAHLAALREKRR